MSKLKARTIVEVTQTDIDRLVRAEIKSQFGGKAPDNVEIRYITEETEEEEEAPAVESVTVSEVNPETETPETAKPEYDFSDIISPPSPTNVDVEALLKSPLHDEKPKKENKSFAAFDFEDFK